MDAMLPALPSASPSLADVLPSSVAAMLGRDNELGLSPLRSMVVVLVDGLGADALARRAGHARFLSSMRGRRSTMFSGFPTTTAAGIASLCTGLRPGEHGLVGYRVRDVAHDRTVNQLSGWDESMRPEAWQPNETVFDTARERGIAPYAVGHSRYRESGFTRAVLRGAEYVGVDDLAERFLTAAHLASGPHASLVYVYVHELDVIAHAQGWESERWLTRLEDVDAAVSTLSGSLAPGVGAVVTADHGVLDVARERQVLVDRTPGLLDGVRHIGGEPRCLQLYVEPDAPAGHAGTLAEAWRREHRDAAWVATRDEAAQAGWFGPRIRADVAPRIGDVLVAARKRIVFYDSRTADDRSRAMVGQHGSLSQEETRVPLIRLGAART